MTIKIKTADFFAALAIKKMAITACQKNFDIGSATLEHEIEDRSNKITKAVQDTRG